MYVGPKTCPTTGPCARPTALSFTNGHSCAWTNATHSKVGKVLLALLFTSSVITFALTENDTFKTDTGFF